MTAGTWRVGARLARGGGQNRAMAVSHSFGTLPVVDVAPLLSPQSARRRTLADPLNREEYMMQLAGRATAASAEQAESSGAR